MSDDYNAAREHAALFDVSNRGKITVRGPDARTFLHNLSTNDIKGLGPGTGCEAFFATAQARAVAYAFIHCQLDDGEDAFWLDLDPGLSEKVMKHLDRYIISEQVELTDQTSEFSQLHLAGPEAESVLARLNLGTDSVVRRHDYLGLPGYDVLCPHQSLEAVRQKMLDCGARPATPATFEILRVESGTPVYGIDIDDNRFVAEVGRTQQAISYTKGCYLGQEPIVMARDRGHINRMLMGLRLSAGDVPARGTLLLREGKEVGQITSSVVSPTFGPIALAYIRRGNSQPGTGVQLEAAGAARTAEVVWLPFSS